MGEGTDSPILVILLACVLSSVVLAGLGLWLKKTKRLTSSRAALAWAILTIIPLFGAGFAMMAKHNVDQLTGKTRSGVNEPPPTS